MAIIGERIVRREDPCAALGCGHVHRQPAARRRWPHVTYARSQMAHARITSIDTSERRRSARRARGVHRRRPRPRVGARSTCRCCTAPMPRPFLADDVVRYVGEPIVAIVAETQAQGEDAAELVDRRLRPAAGRRRSGGGAERRGAAVPRGGHQRLLQVPAGGDDLFADCEVVVRQADHQPEGRAVPARSARRRVALGTGRPPDPLAGRAGRPPDPRTADGGVRPAGRADPLHQPGRRRRLRGQGVQLSRRTCCCRGSPGASADRCATRDNRTDSMLGLGHGRGQVQDVEIGGTRDGTGARLPADRRAGHRRVPAHVGDPAVHDAA